MTRKEILDAPVGARFVYHARSYSRALPYLMINVGSGMWSYSSLTGTKLCGTVPIRYLLKNPQFCCRLCETEWVNAVD